MMEIQHIENETEKSMNANVINPLALSELSERFSLVHIMARKLDDLNSRIGVMDDTRKFTFLAAKVHLMSYYFLDNSGFTNLQLQKGLVQAYNSALALIDHCDQADSRNKQFMKYLPGVYMQTLWQSTSIIAKVFHSPFAEYVDAGSGKDLYFRCIQLLSKASILKHDMAYRAAEITHQVWQVFASLTRKNILKPQISIRTRMAASIFFDTLWTMREECGIMSVAPAVLNRRNSENDDSGTQTPSNDNTTGNTSSSGNDKRYEYLPYDPAMRSATPMKFEEDSVSSMAPTPAPLSSIVNTMSTPLSIAEHQQQQRQQQQQQQTTQKEISSDQLINQSSPPLPIFDWDADLVWRDVDMMMNDFGFRVEEVAPL
jgi:transcriptional regulatory protein LEU3